jgi:hypothetical protein
MKALLWMGLRVDWLSFIQAFAAAWVNGCRGPNARFFGGFLCSRVHVAHMPDFVNTSLLGICNRIFAKNRHLY